MTVRRGARFPSDAVERLLAVASTETDSERLASALATLRKIVIAGVLPAVELRRVADIARARLLDSEAPRAWQSALELALSTGDPHLRLMVSGLASGLVQPAFPERVGLNLWARRVAQRALTRYYQARGVLTSGQPADLLPVSQ